MASLVQVVEHGDQATVGPFIGGVAIDTTDFQCGINAGRRQGQIDAIFIGIDRRITHIDTGGATYSLGLDQCQGRIGGYGGQTGQGGLRHLALDLGYLGRGLDLGGVV